MKRFAIILPAATAALASLGGLMYAGSTGYNCVGVYDNRSVAHPPIGWEEYLGACVVVLAASLIPLLVAWRKGSSLRPH